VARKFQILTLIIVVLNTISCAHIAGSLGLLPKEPKVELASVSVGKLSLTSIQVDVLLQIKNRDKKAVQINRFAFDLFLDEFKVAKGERSEPLSIAGDGKADLKIPLLIKFKDAESLIENLMQGKLPKTARAVGTVEMDSFIGGITIPFSRKTDLTK
jgi:LEA14-like dessication related protein